MKAALLKPEFPLTDEGEVFLYVQPFPQEAERLKFNIEGIFALKSDGTEYPFSLALSELSGSVIKRQRALASAQLPPGSYNGISFQIKNAFLMREEGEMALLVSDKPVRIDFPFTVDMKKALVVSLSLRYEESVRDGFSFSPSFSIFIPDKPLFNLIGYVTNRGSHSVTVLDRKSGTVRGIIETGKSPGGIALDRRTRRAYIAVSDEDSIEVVDIISGDIIQKMFLNGGDNPSELVLTPDGLLLFVVNSESDSVSMVDAFTLVELKRLNVGDGPRSILLDRTGRKAYVFNRFSNTISVIDVPTRSVAAVISTEPGPLRGQFNRRGDRLFVFYESSPYLNVFDPFTLNVVKRVFVGTGVSTLKVDTNTDMLYLGRRHDSIIEVYDPFSIIPVETFSAGGGVNYMTIDGEGNNLCVLLPEKNKLVMINLISKRIVSEMDVGEDPFWVTVMEER